MFSQVATGNFALSNKHTPLRLHWWDPILSQFTSGSIPGSSTEKMLVRVEALASFSSAVADHLPSRVHHDRGSG